MTLLSLKADDARSVYSSGGIDLAASTLDVDGGSDGEADYSNDGRTGDSSDEHDTAVMEGCHKFKSSVAQQWQSGLDSTGSATQQLRYLKCEIEGGIGEALGACAAAEPKTKEDWDNFDFFYNKAAMLEEAVDQLQSTRVSADPWLALHCSFTDAGVDGALGDKHNDPLLCEVFVALEIVYDSLCKDRDRAVDICKRKRAKLDEIRTRSQLRRAAMGEEAYAAMLENKKWQKKAWNDAPRDVRTLAEKIELLDAAIHVMGELVFDGESEASSDAEPVV